MGADHRPPSSVQTSHRPPALATEAMAAPWTVTVGRVAMRCSSDLTSSPTKPEVVVQKGCSASPDGRPWTAAVTVSGQ